MFGRKLANEAIAVAREALEKATTAIAEHMRHEAVCTERWNELRHAINKNQEQADRNQEALTRNLRSLWWVIITGGGALILFLAGLIVTLATGHHVA